MLLSVWVQNCRERGGEEDEGGRGGEEDEGGREGEERGGERRRGEDKSSVQI